MCHRRLWPIPSTVALPEPTVASVAFWRAQMTAVAACSATHVQYQGCFSLISTSPFGPPECVCVAASNTLEAGRPVCSRTSARAAVATSPSNETQSIETIATAAAADSM